MMGEENSHALEKRLEGAIQERHQFQHSDVATRGKAASSKRSHSDEVGRQVKEEKGKKEKVTTVWVLILWWGSAAYRVGEYPSKDECMQAVADTVGTLSPVRLGQYSCTPLPRREWRNPEGQKER
jgi:hypothetical protein